MSLDIKNMFNAVSRECLSEIIAECFPILEPFAELIYDGKGETFVQKEDGTWIIIDVHEGFSQGCPASPVFAAFVLHDILCRIQPDLERRATHRALNDDKGDDNLGSLGFILSYVDDVNCMLHHDDVALFSYRSLNSLPHPSAPSLIRRKLVS